MKKVDGFLITDFDYSLKLEGDFGSLVSIF